MGERERPRSRTLKKGGHVPVEKNAGTKVVGPHMSGSGMAKGTRGLMMVPGGGELSQFSFLCRCFSSFGITVFLLAISFPRVITRTYLGKECKAEK